MADQSILWRRLDRPGHEFLRISRKEPWWRLTGTAVFAHEQQPCRLDYLIVCDLSWRTVSGRVTGWLGTQEVEIDVSVESPGRWLLNGEEVSAVARCADLDLNFSPSTNLLPIRRLDLAVGEQAEVQAAWLRFPSFTLERLEQVYRRIDAETYRYESAGGAFVTEIQVNAAGLVTRYPNFCDVERDD
ncbi:MAG TPA: putative glycolipid-binding domain-containing protein [Blastocatellia bacterium]|nr:putative glycolipid-binding domain-containing protein [Blastocatellia bacterium]